MYSSTPAPVRVRNRISLFLSSKTGRPAGTFIRKATAALALGVFFILAAAEARAANECGPPEAGVEIVCSPSNYDPAGGNIFYGHDELSGDFTIRLTGDLSINYDRNNPGDDMYAFPLDLEILFSSAVWITPGEFAEYTGDVSLYSSADMISNARGIFAGHYGESGALRMEILGGDITTTGESSHAIRGYRYLNSLGDVEMIVRDVTVATVGPGAWGISSLHRGDGDVNLDVRGVTVSTAGAKAYGVIGLHGGEGRLNVDAQDVAIDTAGDGARGIYAQHAGTGDVNVDAQDLAVTTAGENADGVSALHTSAGDVNVQVRDIAVTTTGEGAEGIALYHGGSGSARIAVEGGSIHAAGTDASGIYAQHTGTGDVNVDAQDLAVTTRGEGAEGIALYHGGSGSARIAVEGGSIHAAGTDASGIRMGSLNEDGTVEFAAPAGEDGYRKQSVTVNGAVMGGSGANAAGVFLAGGGKVAIGPRGSLGAASRVAILASGGAPRLRVDMNLDGRRVAEAIGDDRIINDGGETTVAVNGVTLHEGASGATGRAVLNGAWDVTLRESETVRGRTFTSEEFTETYAPRAAVYEALPGFLLRIDAPGFSDDRIVSPGSPVWARISGGRGSYEPGRASVGAGELDADLPAAHGDGDRALPGHEPGQFAPHRTGDGAPAGLLFRAQKTER